MSSSPSKVVSTTIRASGLRSRMVVIASTPSISGMRRSIRATSGRCRKNCSTAWRPLPASATTVMSGSRPIIATRPSRTTWWSSATSTRMTSLGATVAEAGAVVSVGGHGTFRSARLYNCSGYVCTDTITSVPPSGWLVTRNRPRDLLGPLAHADEAEAVRRSTGGRRVEAPAVVPDAQSDRARARMSARPAPATAPRGAGRWSGPPGRCAATPRGTCVGKRAVSPTRTASPRTSVPAVI